METTVSRHTNQSTPTPILRLCKSLANFVDGCDVEVWDRDRKIGRIAHAKNTK
jgi:hypothetical protein